MPYSREVTSRHLKSRMALAGMTIADLAAASGMSEDAISGYTRGATVPKLDTVFALAEALGCTPNDLCGWEEVD